MVARKTRRRKTIVLTFAANSSTESETGRIRRAAPVVQMPLRNPEDTITQGDLQGLRVSWEIVNELLRAASNVEDSLQERIRAGAAIEPGREKFEHRGGVLKGMER